MSRSEDINTLFRRFGGDVSDYQEIVESDKEQDIKKTWPLLAQMDLNHAPTVPSVQFSDADIGSVPLAEGVELPEKKLPVALKDHLHAPSKQVAATATNSAVSHGGANLFAKFSKFPHVDAGSGDSLCMDTKLKAVFSRLANRSLPVASAPRPLKKPIKW